MKRSGLSKRKERKKQISRRSTRFYQKFESGRNVTLALASEDDGSATSGEGFRDRGGKSLSIDEAGGSNFALAASTFSFSFSFSFSNDATGTVSFAGARVILTALLR